MKCGGSMLLNSMKITHKLAIWPNYWLFLN
jgi:hypothetical protein